jgi:long-chain acyl-CoA synthetase
MLEEAVARNGSGEALVCGDARLDWAGLCHRVASAARGLADRGVERGDRVGILLGNRLEFPIAFLGAVWLGAIPVPISIREQRPGLEYILRHCRAKVLVHDSDLLDRLPDGPSRMTAEEFSTMSLAGSPAPPAPAAEDDTCAILYTSGTTGRPKGAMLTNLGIVHSSMTFESCMELSTETRSVAAVPLSHVTGVVALLTAIVRCAGTLIVMPSFRPRAFLELAARERMTHSVLVPAMYNLCLLEPDFERFDLSRWRVGAFGGAPLPEATITTLAEKLPDLRLMNAYGATETTSPATLMPPGETAARRDSVGLPVPGAEIRAVEGELWIRGPMVVPGYWKDPEATDREFTDGFWRTGDLGSIDSEGFVRVRDRKKDVINRGGYKVFSVEVENVLMEHPAVIEAAVVARPCPVLGERVHAFVTVREMVDEAELREFCSGRLADYRIPESFTTGTEPLPRNANGKILKRELRIATAPPPPS